jgi:type II secretory pathway pseudopilin PulG
MKKWSTYFFSEKGLTLIEILASITILFIVIMSLLSFFVQSSRTNTTSKKIADATYVAEGCMEEISNSVTASGSIDTLNLNGYKKIVGTTSNYEKYPNTTGHYIFIEIVPKDNPLVTVRVKVYKDSSKSSLEAQMENLLAWKQP